MQDGPKIDRLLEPARPGQQNARLGGSIDCGCSGSPTARRIALLALVVIAIPNWLGAQKLGPISIETSGREIAAVGQVEGCRVSLEWIQSEEYLRYRNDCGSPLNVKMQAFAALAAELSKQHRIFDTARSLSIGRIVITFPEMARQLALAAYKSPKWDAKRGRAAGSGRFDFGKDNAFFSDAVIELNLLEPVNEVLKPHGLFARAVSVEKVLAGPAKQISVGKWLIEQGVPPEAKLPFDAQTWLRLERIDESK